MSEQKDLRASEQPKPPTPFGQLQGLLERMSGISDVNDSRGRYQGLRRIEVSRERGDLTFRVEQRAIVDRWDDRIEINMSAPDADTALRFGTRPYGDLATIAFSEKPPLVQLRIKAAATLPGHFAPLLGLDRSSWRQDPNDQKSWSTSTEAEAARFVDILTAAAIPAIRIRSLKKNNITKEVVGKGRIAENLPPEMVTAQSSRLKEGFASALKELPVVQDVIRRSRLSKEEFELELFKKSADRDKLIQQRAIIGGPINLSPEGLPKAIQFEHNGWHWRVTSGSNTVHSALNIERSREPHPTNNFYGTNPDEETYAIITAGGKTTAIGAKGAEIVDVPPQLRAQTPQLYRTLPSSPYQFPVINTQGALDAINGVLSDLHS